MSSLNPVGLDRIKSNPRSTVVSICNTLINIFDKILSKPDDEQSRRLLLESDEVAHNLMPYDGGLEVLFESGFIEEDEGFFLPLDASLQALRAMRDRVELIRNEHQKVESQACSTSRAVEKRPQSVSLATTILNKQFASRLLSSYDHVMMYEDVRLKRKALGIIPDGDLRQRALLKFNSYKITPALEGNNPPLDFEDFVLIELLAWFKNEFFSWVNHAECESCGNVNTVPNGIDSANNQESIWMAQTVEIYKCNQCGHRTRFPRYNHPGKLLETRRGRCGEWANCFCLCLRALDYDARYVLDWTDHVWCEVYSRSQKRWLHADPCENALDKPLIYEHGWKKNLTYVIAFSRHECVDVTWRYSSKHKEVMKRRAECDENWLATYTNQLSQKRQTGLSKADRETIQLRLVNELVEFLSPKIIKEGEDVGRQSGSLQWRLERGETHASPNQAGTTITVDSSSSRFGFKYSTAKNQYISWIGDDSKTTELRDWSSAAYSYSNIQLKVEHDWKMCYLARTTGSAKSFIEWRFEFDQNLLSGKKKLREIEINFDYKCFESGQINVAIGGLEGQKETDLMPLSHHASSEHMSCVQVKENVHTISILNKSLTGLRLRAELSGGNGDCAWQHTQLFRQSITDSNCLLQTVFYFD